MGAAMTATLIVHDNNQSLALKPVTITSLDLVKMKVIVGNAKHGKAKTKVETVIQLKFSGAVDGAGNKAAYKLFLGKTKKRVTTFHTPLPLASANYSAPALTATLIPVRKLNLSILKQLRVTGSLLADGYGRALDGDDDGQPGGDLVTTFKNRGITFAPVRTARVTALTAATVDLALAGMETGRR